MDFNATIDLIIKDLNEASEIIDDLKKYPGVPALQVELAKSKCKSAGALIGLLKSLSNVFPAKEEPFHDKQSHDESGTQIKPVVEKKVESEETMKNEAEIPILADRFRHEATTKAEKDLSDKLKDKPITNLSEAIGINDRFLFTSEIFDGNKDAYKEAISRLDNTDSLIDAMAIIMSYTGDKPENEAVIKLLDLVKRKLPSYE